MSKKNKLFQKLFIAVAPFLASSVLGISPSRAATFASSTSNLEFTNFSQAPSSVSAFADTDADSQLFGKRAIAGTQTEANASFVDSPAFASNENLSKAFGDNQAYLASAESESEVIGDFEIKAGNNFSFDFTGNLNLETSIDNPLIENAVSTGEIFFGLWDIDNETLLDNFSLIGNLTGKDDNDFIELDKSNNVNLNENFDTNFGGLEESIEAPIKGSYKRFFANDTNLRLVEFKLNTAIAKAPEPSTGLALLLSSGVIGVMLKRRRK